MTMPKAVAFLVISLAIAAAGIALLAVRIDGGLVDGTIGARDPGARTGQGAATPSGGSGRISPGQAGASATAAWRTVTALAQTRTVPRGTATPSPQASVAAVRIGEPVTFRGSRYTVLQVTDPEPPGLFPTRQGHRRVALEITQEAVGATASYNFAYFKLRAADGAEYTWALTNSQPSFSAGSLAAGQARTGWIAFELPAGAEPDALVLSVIGQSQEVTLVKLR